MSLGGTLSPAIVGLAFDRPGRQWPAIYALLALPALSGQWFTSPGFAIGRKCTRRSRKSCAIIRGLPAPTAAEVAGTQPAGHEPTDNGPLAMNSRLRARRAAPLAAAAGQPADVADLFSAVFPRAHRSCSAPGSARICSISPGLSAEVAYLAGARLVMLIIGGVLGGTLFGLDPGRTGSRRGRRVFPSSTCSPAPRCSPPARAVPGGALVSMASLAMALGEVSAFAITMDMGEPTWPSCSAS